MSLYHWWVLYREKQPDVVSFIIRWQLGGFIVNPIVLSLMWAKCIGCIDVGLNLLKFGSYFGFFARWVQWCQVGRIVVLNVAILPWKLESSQLANYKVVMQILCVCVCVSPKIESLSPRKPLKQGHQEACLFMAQKEKPTFFL